MKPLRMTKTGGLGLLCVFGLWACGSQNDPVGVGDIGGNQILRGGIFETVVSGSEPESDWTFMFAEGPSARNPDRVIAYAEDGSAFLTGRFTAASTGGTTRRASVLWFDQVLVTPEPDPDADPEDPPPDYVDDVRALAERLDAVALTYADLPEIVEIVDFILRSADAVLRQEFGQGLTDEGVHILDGFTGTGTFIVELMEHFRGRPEKLAWKYLTELYANEVAILPYYVANLNIERLDRALLVARAGTDGDNFALGRLFLGCIRNDDSASRLFLGFDAADQNAVMQWTELHACFPPGQTMLRRVPPAAVPFEPAAGARSGWRLRAPGIWFRIFSVSRGAKEKISTRQSGLLTN